MTDNLEFFYACELLSGDIVIKLSVDTFFCFYTIALTYTHISLPGHLL